MFEISFLQDKYIFPDEVKEYGEYLKKIQIMSENMQELFFEDIKKGNPVYRTDVYKRQVWGWG